MTKPYISIIVRQINVEVNETQTWICNDKLIIIAVSIRYPHNEVYYTLGNPNPQTHRGFRWKYYYPKCAECMGYLTCIDKVAVCEKCDRIVENMLECATESDIT